MDAINEDPIVGNRVEGRNLMGNCDRGTIQSIGASKRNKVYIIKWDDNSQTEVVQAKFWVIYEKEEDSCDGDNDGNDGDTDDEMQDEYEKQDEQVDESLALNAILPPVAQQAPQMAPPIVVPNPGFKAPKKLTKKQETAQKAAREAIDREQAARIAGPAMIIAGDADPNAPAAAPIVPIVDLLTVIDGKTTVKWEKVDLVSDNIELGAEAQPRECNTELKWDPHQPTASADRKHLDYFLLSFPVKYLATILGATNEAYAFAGMAEKAPSFGLLIKFLGIMLAMALLPIRGSRNDHWSTEGTPGSVFDTAQNYGERFGMSRNVYADIHSNFRLASFSAAQKLIVSYFMNLIIYFLLPE